MKKNKRTTLFSFAPAALLAAVLPAGAEAAIVILSIAVAVMACAIAYLALQNKKLRAENEQSKQAAYITGDSSRDALERQKFIAPCADAHSDVFLSEETAEKDALTAHEKINQNAAVLNAADINAYTSNARTTTAEAENGTLRNTVEDCTGNKADSTNETEDADLKDEAAAVCCDFKRTTFNERLDEAPEESKALYERFRRHALSIGCVKGNVSKQYENFNLLHQPMAKINIHGKTLTIYLAATERMLEDSNYKREYVGDVKKHERTPYCFKIRGERSLNNVLRIMDKIAEDLSQNRNCERK